MLVPTQKKVVLNLVIKIDQTRVSGTTFSFPGKCFTVKLFFPVR